jgi:hypothetical protein
MTCSDIIEIIGILVSAGMGIWIATAITNGHTRERFLKDYFTMELNGIKEECKAFFDDICFDKKSAQDIKIGFKILSMRLSAFESNLGEAFKNASTTLPNSIKSIQLEITDSDDFNEQFKKTKVKFSSSAKNSILEKRSTLLTEFSKAIIVINKASVKNNKRQ